MNHWTNYISKGALSWAVMVMLVVALIAGQVRAGLQQEAMTVVEPLTEREFRMHSDSFDDMEFVVIDKLLPLAIDVSFTAEPGNDPVQK